MRTLAMLAVVVSVVPATASPNAGVRSTCVTACATVAAECVAMGGGKAQCRRHWRRLCRQGGPASCLVPPPTTTTTTTTSSSTTLLPCATSTTLPPAVSEAPVSLFCDPDDPPQACACHIDPTQSITGTLVVADSGTAAWLRLTGNVVGGAQDVTLVGGPASITLYGRDWDGFDVRGTSCDPAGCCVEGALQFAPAATGGVVGGLSLVRRGCDAPCSERVGVNVPKAAL